MPPLLRATGTLTLALPAILLSGCASTPCEEWGTRVESVRVCGPKGMNCTFQDRPVQDGGKPLPGKQFPHAGPINPNVVAKAVTQTFPAE